MEVVFEKLGLSETVVKIGEEGKTLTLSFTQTDIDTMADILKAIEGKYDNPFTYYYASAEDEKSAKRRSPSVDDLFRQRGINIEGTRTRNLVEELNSEISRVNELAVKFTKAAEEAEGTAAMLLAVAASSARVAVRNGWEASRSSDVLAQISALSNLRSIEELE